MGRRGGAYIACIIGNNEGVCITIIIDIYEGSFVCSIVEI